MLQFFIPPFPEAYTLGLKLGKEKSNKEKIYEGVCQLVLADIKK